jgi:DNA processing protein
MAGRAQRAHCRDRSGAVQPDADTPADDHLPEEAYAAALASVPGIGPKTLRALLEDASPTAAWEAVTSGRAHVPTSRRAGAATRGPGSIDVRAVWQAHREAGIRVSVLGRPGYPAVLADDPEAPAVLFSLGEPRVLDGAPRVAVVGTRSATRYGLGVAAQLGADLAAAGVVVVSGLALGIDGAAHEGAVAAWRTSCSEGAPTLSETGARPRPAPPVGVVAGSVDSPYPRQHAGLWRRVAAVGAVVSEAPIGVADVAAWRFPMRNRIIAAVCDVVVVVECHSRGGSLHTVAAATARGIPVGAVPGSVRSPASAGTNALLADGCFVVRDAADALVAVGLSWASTRPPIPSSGVSPPASPVSDLRNDDLPSPTKEIADAVGWDPTPLDEILERSGLAMADACGALERLRARGIVHGEGGWWERA